MAANPRVVKWSAPPQSRARPFGVVWGPGGADHRAPGGVDHAIGLHRFEGWHGEPAPGGFTRTERLVFAMTTPPPPSSTPPGGSRSLRNGFALAASAVPIGVTANPVTIEVHVTSGLPAFTLVGIADGFCREIRDRLRAAIINADYQWPQRRITIAIRPYGLTRAPGPTIDLPIAIGLLAATNQITIPADETVAAFGELGLDGTIRPVASHIALLHNLEGDRVIVPDGQDTHLAHRNRQHNVAPLGHLRDLAQAFTTKPRVTVVPAELPPKPPLDETQLGVDRLAGATPLERALHIAVAGRHHTLIVGSAGSGKTQLLTNLARLLPPLGPDEWAKQVTIRSAAADGPGSGELFSRVRPFRLFDPTTPIVTVIGGSTRSLRPGEVTLAHRGVLALDDLDHHDLNVLDAIAGVVDRRQVRVLRGSAATVMPADIQLVATATPCRCGSPTAACTCSETSLVRHRRSLSPRFLDRFDIVIDLDDQTSTRNHSRVRDLDIDLAVPGPETDELLPHITPLDDEARTALHGERDDGWLTNRGHSRVWRLAWTIHQLQGGNGPITLDTILEALAMHRLPPSWTRT